MIPLDRQPHQKNSTHMVFIGFSRTYCVFWARTEEVDLLQGLLQVYRSPSILQVPTKLQAVFVVALLITLVYLFLATYSSELDSIKTSSQCWQPLTDDDKDTFFFDTLSCTLRSYCTTTIATTTS
jgi:hypothetical protein